MTAMADLNDRQHRPVALCWIDLNATRAGLSRR